MASRDCKESTMKLIPYLHFAGNAEEALHFYTEALEGEILSIQRYADAPVPSDEDYKQKIMHARFQFDGNLVMISDVFKGSPLQVGNNVQLSVDVDDADKMERLFAKMAAGGKIRIPLENTFWGARFGMVEDKFGVLWMFNHELKKDEEDK